MSGKPAFFKFGRYSSAGVLAVSLLATGLSSCGKNKGKPDNDAKIPGSAAVFKSPTSTVLTGQKAVRLIRMRFEDTLEVPLRIDLDERRSVHIASPAAGRLEDVFIRSADQVVKAGDPIATLYSPELVTAQREFLLIDQKSNAGLLNDAASRLKLMGMTSSQIQFIRRTGKPLERIPIVSPMAGFVVPAMGSLSAGGAMGGTGGAATANKSDGGMGGASGGGMGMAAKSGSQGQGRNPEAEGLKVGAYIERGTPLASVNDLAVVAATLALPIDEATLYKQGDSIHLSIPSVGLSVMTHLEYLESMVSDTNRSLIAKAYIPNPSLKLRPGTLGKAHLTSGVDSFWAVPRSAVRNLGEKWIVWAQSVADTTAFQAREVRLGRRGMHFVEILRGLSPGEAVAENASLLVDPDAAIEPVPLPDSTTKAELASHVETHPENHGETTHASHNGMAQPGQHEEHAGQDSASADSGKESHSGHNGALTIPSDKEELAGIRMQKAKMAILTPSITFRATTKFDARSSVNVPTRVDGTVELVLFRRPGEKVVKGQVMAKIRSDALLAAQQEFLLAVSQAKTLPDKAMARSQVQAARRRLGVSGMSESDIDALVREGKISALQSIVSPRSGVVLEVDVQPRQYVREGASLFLVGGSDLIWVETWMLPEELVSFPEGSEAWVEIEGFQGESIQGKLEHARQETEASGGLAIAHVGIPNPEGKILPGVQAWVTLKEKGRAALSIPPSALLGASNSITTWIRISPNQYAPRMVKVGLRTPTAVEILGGIRDGEDVVVSGAYLLNSESIIRQGRGMAHSGM